MDRRTWLQLIGILSAARTGFSQPPQPQQPLAPMRVSKDQVVAALKLLGLEFQEAEIDMMLPGVNRALASYESLRKVDVPLDTQNAATTERRREAALDTRVTDSYA